MPRGVPKRLRRAANTCERNRQGETKKAGPQGRKLSKSIAFRSYAIVYRKRYYFRIAGSAGCGSDSQVDTSALARGRSSGRWPHGRWAGPPQDRRLRWRGLRPATCGANDVACRLGSHRSATPSPGNGGAAVGRTTRPYCGTLQPLGWSVGSYAIRRPSLTTAHSTAPCSSDVSWTLRIPVDCRMS